MMSSNWLVGQANKDRAALRALGVCKSDEAAMSHHEVCKELKRRGYSWKKQDKRNGHGCP